jgi:hypothetical protein
MQIGNPGMEMLWGMQDILGEAFKSVAPPADEFGS